MKKHTIKGFVSGILVCLIVSQLLVPALAASLTKQATLLYNDIKITLNGNAIVPKDANGAVVEPFAIDGTTYLPVRAISNALGLGVDWDSSTSTVVLSSEHAIPSGTVLFEKNGIKITYLGIAPMRYGGGEEVKLFIQNTSSRNYCIMTRDESVNDIMFYPAFSCDVVAGKSAYTSIEFYDYELEACHITSISSVEFYFHVFDYDSWSGDFYSEIIKITK